MKSKILNIWLLAFFGLITILVSSYLSIIHLEPKDKNLSNIYSIVGSVATAVGLIITFFQFLNVALLVRENHLEILNTKKQLQIETIISDIDKGISFIKEAQSLLRNHKYESTELRMQDLKPIMTKIKYHDTISQEIKSKFDVLFMDFNIDLRSLLDKLSNMNLPINNSKIISNLDNTSIVLYEINEKLNNKL